MSLGKYPFGTPTKPEYLNRTGRPLLDNGYDKSGVCIFVWVTIVNTFTRQRIHRQTFPAQRSCRFVTTDEPNPSTRSPLLGRRKSVLRRCRHREEQLRARERVEQSRASRAKKTPDRRGPKQTGELKVKKRQSKDS
jgi:hypothetical protein